MTDAEYRDFLKAYEDMLRNRPGGHADDEKLTDPKAKGGNLRNIGPKQMKPTGKDNKTNTAGIALPPPEFRDAYKEFTEKISGLEKPPNR
jgi:hypothetical protein